jgi:pimeloyl-ACP methyl ester carboxylesterase
VYNAPVTLTELARLSDIAYLDKEEGKAAAAELGFTTKKMWNNPPAQAWLWVRDGVAVLAYRGTEASELNIRDLLSNSRFGDNPWTGPGKANAGYARQFEAIRPAAEGIINSVASEIPLIITGHSMGGAIATLTAAWLDTKGWKAAGLVTFGAPKALTRNGLSAINMEVVRVVNRYDFAPHWPALTNKRHPEGKLSVNSGGWPGPVSRHAPSKYIEAVNQLEGLPNE